jgi:hypothetical protein
MQGFSATLIATGFYELRFPATPRFGTRIYPTVRQADTFGPTGVLLAPSGVTHNQPKFDAKIAHIGSESGYAHLSTLNVPLVPSALGGVTGMVPVNPPTGAVVELQFLVGPAIGRF